MVANEAVEVIYRDEYLVAINKPAGLLVHRSPIDRRETRFALQQVRDQIGRHVFPVHRLDKPTSGVLVFALSPAVARHLAGQFAAGAVDKCYLAVARGYCPEQGRIDYPLREKPDRVADRDRTQQRPVQAAVTHFQRLGTVEIPAAVERYPRTRYSLVALRPETGRKHQLRRHMKHIGHPLIGDAKHGKGVHNRFFQSNYDCHRLLLACTALGLGHPASGARLQLRARLDAPFLRVLAAFGWQDLAWAPERPALTQCQQGVG